VTGTRQEVSGKGAKPTCKIHSKTPNWNVVLEELAVYSPHSDWFQSVEELT